MRKLFYYGLTGFLLALILVSINSMVIEQKFAVKQSAIKREESNMKALINKSSTNFISKAFSLLIYVFSLIAGLTVYLIVKHYYVKEELR